MVLLLLVLAEEGITEDANSAIISAVEVIGPGGDDLGSP